jgi:type II secretory pathway pseudopilin PulG
MLSLVSRRFVADARLPRHGRAGISLLEIIVAMTLLAVILVPLGLLSSQNATRARSLDFASARTFVLSQQADRFSVLPYDSIPSYAPRTDTVIAGRFKYLRRVSYVQGTTGSEYKTVTVLLLPLPDTTRRDSMIFQRAKTYARSPLFQ